MGKMPVLHFLETMSVIKAT